MPVSIDVEERIALSPGEVWAALTNWDRAHEWMAGIDSMASGGPTETGTVLTFLARGKQRESEITAVAPGRQVSLTSRQGPVCATYTYTCAPDGHGTRLRLVADCEIRGPLKLLGPLLRTAIRRTDGGQLRALKELLEPATVGCSARSGG